MFQAFVITLREGIEAFLIVAISISYLRQTGREAFLPAAYWGVAVSVVTSALSGYFFSLASNQAFWEGTLAIVASLLVATLVIHVWRTARMLKNQIQVRLDSVARSRSFRAAWWGVFLFIVIMVTREGMEAALLFGTLMFQMKAPQILLGALLGIFAAAGLAFIWSRYGHLVNLPRFFQATAVFLLVFVGQLLIYGVHELAEANVLPNSTVIHDATEVYGPAGVYGQWLTFALVALPMAWLVFAWFRERTRRSKIATAVARVATSAH